MKLTMIVSGGQTGADQAGLRAGRLLGLETGGYAALGWMTDEGPQRALLQSFGLVEWSEPGYAARTHANAALGDVTLWFGRSSPGYRCTRAGCKRAGHLFVDNPTLAQIQALARKYEIFNIAGNRERINPGIGEQTFLLLVDALGVHVKI